MGLLQTLSVLALRQLAEGAASAVGLHAAGGALVDFLADRFTDHSQRLTQALQTANERAWKALEIALAGESVWDRCKSLAARGEDKAFAQQVRTFLDTTPLPELAGKTAFRQQCLQELRAARKAHLLTGGTLDPKQVAQQTGALVRFGDPKNLLDAEWRLVEAMADELRRAGYSSLGWLLAQRPQQGTPLLVVGVRYFFRRAVEEDQKLFQGLAFAKLEALGETQEKGFAALSGALAHQGQRLEDLLGDVRAVVVETHAAVLDLHGQLRGQGEQIQHMGQAVLKLLEQHQLQRRELRPADSMSIRNEGERKLVKQVVARFRALPEAERQRLPALLNAVGKLEVVAGDFEAAQKDFQQVATLVRDTVAQAEAHFNAYRTALERRDWDTALKELLHAVKLDAKRFAPFPVGKYHPQRILGAGGFGVAFSCRHKELKAEVVVKTLVGDDLEREVDEVFNEARVLYQLDHPAIVRLLDCGYTFPAEKARPYLVMNFFDGMTLEQHVQKNGPLPPEDMAEVARLVAEGLQAAHGTGILHRDVKPANMLVRRGGSGWQVKLIDFGLALKHSVIEYAAQTAEQGRTLTASSIAGTLDYAAPEQMGRLPGETVGPRSDIYGWAKTCCYGLFRTTQPLPTHWSHLPKGLAALLEQCLAEDPKQRPSSFAEVLKSLSSLTPSRPHSDRQSSGKAVTPGLPSPAGRGRKPISTWVLAGAGAVAIVVVLWCILPKNTPVPPKDATNSAVTSKGENVQGDNGVRVNVPTPVVKWPFGGNSDARVGSEGLQLHVKGVHVRTVPLSQDIRERTLEAWVTLTNLVQRSTIMTISVVEKNGSRTWDGIVYGEPPPAKKWYPGSSFTHRSRDAGGPPESAKLNELVQVAIVYSLDNSITLYRNGKIYGRPFVPSGPYGHSAKLQTYPAKTSSLSISADRESSEVFVGEVIEARLYDRALSDLEIAASFAAGSRLWSRPK